MYRGWTCIDDDEVQKRRENKMTLLVDFSGF